MRIQPFLWAFVALAVIGGSVSAASTYDNALSLANVSVSPNPVLGGGDVHIKFRLYNTFNYNIYGTTLQPSGTYPLLNVSPQNSIVLGQVSSGFSSSYYNYTFAVPNTTTAGSYTVTFTATYFVYAATGTVIATSAMPVTFYVQNKPSITVTLANPQPAALYSGYNQSVSLHIQNTGYGTARNVTVSVSPGPGLDILSSVTTFFISNLTHNSTVTEPLLISAHNTSSTSIIADASFYSSTLQQRFSSTQSVNLSVSPSAQFAISSGDTEPKVGAVDVPVHMKVTNTGTAQARQMQLNLQTSYPLTPVASTAYVNSLEPGASANVTFLVNIDTAAVPGNYPVTLYEQWKQPNGAVNQQFSGSDNYFVTVANPGYGIPLLPIAAVAIIAVIAARFYMARKSAKGKNGKAEKAKK
ncbi:MAG: hypothetical protein KGH69_00215 [Candidatus Micrarchaeota archaeon]|nr:hypothetical protein [Candidatus Micrarchaeota archaeon]